MAVLQSIFHFKPVNTLTLYENCPNTELFIVPYFPVFALNTEIYRVNFRIQSENRKIQTRNNSIFGHFPRSVNVLRSLEH